MYERVMAIVPIVGAGTFADPKRPMLAPLPSQMKPGNRAGIIAFHHEVSDDGKLALVEFVGVNKASLAPLLAQARAMVGQTSGVQVFQRGVNSRAEIEAAFKSVKKYFNFDKFEVAVP